jgi:hypothetical protein
VALLFQSAHYSILQVRAEVWEDVHMGRLIGVTLVLEVCLRLLASTANSVFQHYPLFAERSAVLAEAYDAAEK